MRRLASLLALLLLPAPALPAERPICTAPGPVGDLLRKWYAEGTAAGNTGDFYDNRDRDHSPLDTAPWPQLDRVVYSEAQRQRRADWAAQHVILPHVTFGNSSTSAPVLNRGSNVRMYYVHPQGAAFLYEQYRKNNLYMYPGHHDHHPGRNGKPFYGDVYPANTPYLITSQGSSGTDQPFMRVVPYTLAAFRPEVKKKLVETGLLMPTVQMLLRSSNKHLKDPKEYLTGKAHPTVFEGSWVDDLKMVQAAHAIRLEEIPPLVQLKVVEEDEPVDGKDYFEAGKSEKLFDTPDAIARIVRGAGYVRRIVVSAEESFDANKRPLTFRWVVLRGEAARIQIKPRNESGSVVELRVPYHERRPIPDSPLKIDSNRVDIGVFVHNGAHYSAPAFVTFFSLDSEARTYDRDGKLLEIGYGAGEASVAVSDWPALFATLQVEPATWSDQMLRKQLNEVELAALRKTGEEYQQAASRREAQRDKVKKLNEVRQKAAESLKIADEKRKAAQKAHADKSTAETEAALKKATSEQEAATQNRQAAEKEVNEAQKSLDASTKEMDDLLSQKRPGLEPSVKGLLERLFGKLKDEPTFYLIHRADIDAQLASGDGKNRLAAARKRAVNLGLFSEKDDKFSLSPIRTGDAPLAERLTSYEKCQLERFHAELLHLLYQKFLAHAYTVNFVDQRLTGRKDWRDIYHHDAKGAITGWTRRSADGVQDFTADGLLIVAKDDQGRAIKARRVQYTKEMTADRSGTHSIVAEPSKTVAIEYDAKDGTSRTKEEEDKK